MKVTLTELLMGIVVLPFLWIVLDWSYGVLLRGRLTRVRRRSMRSCHLCGKNYEEARRVKVSSCPECEGQNDRRGHRKLG